MQRPTAAPLPPPLPPDVRWMNAAASSVYALAAVGALAAAALWVMRSPLFPIRSIELDGELTRNSVPTIRANASPKLAGNFFSADLQQARAAFEAVPWVRHAVLRRVWPDRLAVRLEEHRAAALWEGNADAPGGDRLVNSFGEVFEANLGDVEDDHLPVLAGPDGSAASMLVLLRRLQPVFEGMDARIERLALSGRGSWRVDLDSGATIELGRGSDDAISARSKRFARTVGGAIARWNAPLEYADLRQADGYALRLRGVSTGGTANDKAGDKTGKAAGKPAAKPAGTAPRAGSSGAVAVAATAARGAPPLH